MRLYHGTSSRHLEAILRDGILPRSKSGEVGNWNGGWKSKSDFVYLSTAYPVYYASATRGSDTTDMVIFEIDETKLAKLYPDDEFVARLYANPKEAGSVEELLPMIDPADHQELWNASLEENGTICCKFVPPNAIKRHRTLKWDASLWFGMGGDSLPSPINYLLWGPDYMEAIAEFVDNGEDAVKALLEERQRPLLDWQQTVMKNNKQ